MRKFCIFLIAATLAACGPTHVANMPPPPLSTGSLKPLTATTIDERALLGAEVAYGAANAAGIVAIRSGVLDQGAVQDVARYDSEAHALLISAREMYAAGDRLGAAEAVNAMRDLLDRLRGAAGQVLP